MLFFSKRQGAGQCVLKHDKMWKDSRGVKPFAIYCILLDPSNSSMTREEIFLSHLSFLPRISSSSLGLNVPQAHFLHLGETDEAKKKSQEPNCLATQHNRNTPTFSIWAFRGS
ncbi:hypothetical protein XENOCAPTIV_027124 [Xenoophorus captivus]|uniref:Uncharacterized protein n=1 Tax=Xenoophorus captivus TaxID=1517983 RepID=A0ABV0SHH3_9TELE